MFGFFHLAEKHQSLTANNAPLPEVEIRKENCLFDKFPSGFHQKHRAEPALCGTSNIIH